MSFTAWFVSFFIFFIFVTLKLDHQINITWFQVCLTFFITPVLQLIIAGIQVSIIFIKKFLISRKK